MPKSNQLVKEQFYRNKTGWIKSYNSGLPCNAQGENLPWYSYPAIEFLKDSIKKTDSIFEFGCGSSTIFYSKLADKVISIETNPRWAAIIKNLLKKQMIDNVNIILIANGLEDKDYENYPKLLNQKFDIIAIDSIKRYKCAISSIEQIKKGGRIILDDSERKNYQKIFNFYQENNFSRNDFTGIEPGKLRLKQSTIFWKD